MEKLKNSAFMGLKWLERYTKTDMIYLAKGGFWLGIGQFVASGSAFLTSLAFANLLLPDTYGIYKYVLSIYGLLTISTLSGMDSAVTQAVARNYDGTLLPAVKEKMKWGIAGSAVSVLIALYYFIQGNNILAISFGVVSLFIPFIESFDTYNSLLWGKKLFSTQVNYNIIKKIISLGAIILTVYLTDNIYIILFVYFICIAIPSVFIFYKVKKQYIQNTNVDPEAIGYGKHLSLAYIISTALSELDKILVFQYVGAADLAIYTLATAPTDQVKGLFKNINSLAMPKFAERTSDEIKKTIWHKVRIISLSMTIIVVFYIIIAPYFFNFFFPKYLASIRYSQILSLSLIPVVISGFIYTVLESQKAKKEIYQYNFYGNIFGIIILFPLVYFFGIWGAISSRVITRSFSFALASILVKRIS
jgi:O-antigen/teichoic acid export membrane protein